MSTMCYDNSIVTCTHHMINPEDINLSALPWLPLDELITFPRKPAIYFAIDSANRVQYIGKSIDPRKRWGQHHRFEELNSIGFIKVAFLFIDIDSLKDTELALIRRFKPPFNVVGKPDPVFSQLSPRQKTLPQTESSQATTRRKVSIQNLASGKVVNGSVEFEVGSRKIAIRLLEERFFEIATIGCNGGFDYIYLSYPGCDRPFQVTASQCKGYLATEHITEHITVTIRRS